MSTRTIDKLRLNLAVFLDIAGMTALFGYCWFGIYSQRMEIPYGIIGNIFVMLLFAGIYFLCFMMYGTYRISVSRISELGLNQMLAAIITDSIMYIVCILLCRVPISILPMGILYVVQVGCAFLWSLLVHKWYFATHAPKKTIIIWDTRQGLSQMIDKYDLDRRYQVVKVLHAKQCMSNLSEVLLGMEAVFLSGVHSHDRNRIIKFCIINNIDSYVIPRVGDVIMSAAKPLHLFHLPILKLERYSPSIPYLIIKRVGDICISGIGFVALSPLMLVIAILIKLTDGGTVLYKQRRLTINGKQFELLKFRSMRMDAEKDGIPRLSSGVEDDRITRVGRVIRATRMDELPQLINILKGEMSLVGPRPERPEIAEEYEAKMPEFRLRLQAKAGLTGYAQVYGKYNTSPYDKLLMDLSYIANPSLIKDLSLCFATLKVLFEKESTDGVAKDKRTAMEGEDTQGKV